MTLGDVARFTGMRIGRGRLTKRRATNCPAGGARASAWGSWPSTSNATSAKRPNGSMLYLRDQPRGGLRREAMGRLLESWQRAGDQGKAAKIAQQYLLEYPTGAHAPLARQLTSQ